MLNYPGIKNEVSIWTQRQKLRLWQKLISNRSHPSLGPEDIELYIQLRTQEFDGGQFSSAFEYKKDTKEAIFAFNLKPVPKDYELIDPGQKEYQFVIDRSGSMSGSFMEQAKNALILLLKQLPSEAELKNSR